MYHGLKSNFKPKTTILLCHYLLFGKIDPKMNMQPP